jgi:hypothetical protein
MPRLVIRPPRYCKRKQYAVCYVNGREVSLGRYDSPESREAYRRLVADWCTANGRPDLAARAINNTADALQSITPVERFDKRSAPKSITVAELIVAYLDHCEGYYTKGGKQTSEVYGIKLALRFVRKLYGRLSATDFSPKKLKAVRDAMITAGLARTTINQNVHRIRRMFRWAAADERVPGNVVADLDNVEGCGPVDPRHENQRRLARSLTVTCSGHCRTCRRSSAIWFCCSESPECGRRRSARSAPATRVPS